MADRTITDGEALDAISAWLTEPAIDGQWRSAADFIEHAADLVSRTGRGTDPGPVCWECESTDVAPGGTLCSSCLIGAS